MEKKTFTEWLEALRDNDATHFLSGSIAAPPIATKQQKEDAKEKLKRGEELRKQLNSHGRSL